MSQTCEVVLARCRCGEIHVCGNPTTWRYPAMGGGYAHLCDMHAAKHLVDRANLIGMERIAAAAQQGSGA